MVGYSDYASGEISLDEEIEGWFTIDNLPRIPGKSALPES
jgi:hypothetical protein